MVWSKQRERDKAKRERRLLQAEKIFGQVVDLCQRSGISFERREFIVMFKFHEYVISWPMTTNKVMVQYRMSQHSERVPYVMQDRADKPKIICALETLIALYPARSSDVVRASG